MCSLPSPLGPSNAMRIGSPRITESCCISGLARAIDAALAKKTTPTLAGSMVLNTRRERVVARRLCRNSTSWRLCCFANRRAGVSGVGGGMSCCCCEEAEAGGGKA